MKWEAQALLPDSKFARVFSPSNIALAKYWGKRDKKRNLPTNGSISITLDRYGSFTTVEFNAAFREDHLVLDGKSEGGEKIAKVARVLELLRGHSPKRHFARVQSINNFPTGAGLASSASGLSAVALAGAQALELDLSRERLSEIARQGSGSACRSFFGGFVEWKRGSLADGTDSVASSLAPVSHWPLDVWIAIANQTQKNHASTGGMEHTKETSPYFTAWIENAQLQTKQIREAIGAKDFDALAELAESNCIRMHASAMAAFPPVLYWQGKTLDVLHRVWELRRKEGVACFFTIDAGPNVVVVCEPGAVSSKVGSELGRIPGIQLLKTKVGEGARAFDPREWGGER